MFGWDNLWVDDTRCYSVYTMDGGYEMIEEPLWDNPMVIIFTIIVMLPISFFGFPRLLIWILGFAP